LSFRGVAKQRTWESGNEECASGFRARASRAPE
jgi:hypothetical protein